MVLSQRDRTHRVSFTPESNPYPKSSRAPMEQCMRDLLLSGQLDGNWRKKITHKTDISPNHKFKINFYNHQKQSWNFPISQSELTHRSPPLRRSGLNSVVFTQGLWPWPNPHAPMGFFSAHHTPNPPGTFRAFCGFFLGPHFPGPQLLIQTAFLKLLVL